MSGLITIRTGGFWYVQEPRRSPGCISLWATVAGPFGSAAEAEAEADRCATDTGARGAA